MRLEFFKRKIWRSEKVSNRRNVEELQTEDLITPTDMVVTLSHSGI